MFERGTDATTRMLSGASFNLTRSSSGKGKWFGFVAVFLLMVSAGLYWFMTNVNTQAPEVLLSQEIASLSATNVRLKQESEEMKMRLEHERATREAMEREVASLTESLKQANKNLSFYRKHTTAAPAGAQ